MNSNITAASSPAPRRALSLDALRGLAIFGMCLSGIVPWTGLPDWMYHAQFPRAGVAEVKFTPDHAGFTWVDLVFPAFLFAMGAAFPFALRSRLEKGVPLSRIIPGVFGRGLVIVSFAFYVQHIGPWSISQAPGGLADGLRSLFGLEKPADGPGNVTMILSLVGFALGFPVYSRFPVQWSPLRRRAVRAVGIGGLTTFLFSVNWGVAGEGGAAEQLHSVARGIIKQFDIIIMVLANVAVWGSLIWLATRTNKLLRIGSIAVVFAMIEASWQQDSWIFLLTQPPGYWIERVPLLGRLVGSSHLLQFFLVELPGVAAHLGYCKYLAIVVPGTIVGDLLLEWMRAGDAAESDSREPQALWAMVGLILGLIIFVHAGLEGRWLPVTPLVTIVAMAAAARFIFNGSGDSTERLLCALFRWAFFWMVLGLILESTEGGIKKDPSNRSYYFVSLSLAILLLMMLILLIDVMKYRRPFLVLIGSGQNPMLAYAGIRALLAPLVHLTFMPTKAGLLSLNMLVGEKLFAGMPWPGFIWAFAKTWFMAWSTAVFTRLRIVWRS